MPGELQTVRKCMRCGCTDDDCTPCVKKTGTPCHWVRLNPPLCSACTTPAEVAIIRQQEAARAR